MTRPLVVVLIAVQVLDLVTYLQLPHLEANPVMAALGPQLVIVVKLAGVWTMIAIASRIRTPGLAQLALALAIAAGAFGAGTNIAAIAWAAGS